MTTLKAIDASLALKLVMVEEDSPKAHALWDEWTEHGEVAVAPTLFLAETISGLRRLVYRGKLSVVAGDYVIAKLRGLEIEIMEPVDLYERAWRIARELGRPTVYDSLYVALAESLGCELWTADAGLARVAHPHFPWVRALGDYQRTAS